MVTAGETHHLHQDACLFSLKITTLKKVDGSLTIMNKLIAFSVGTEMYTSLAELDIVYNNL